MEALSSAEMTFVRGPPTTRRFEPCSFSALRSTSSLTGKVRGRATNCPRANPSCIA